MPKILNYYTNILTKNICLIIKYVNIVCKGGGKMTELIISIIALTISIITLFVSFFFNYKDHERRKKQATIEYFESMTTKHFESQAIFNDKMNRADIDIERLEYNPELLKEATSILAAFERLSVGVNTNVFDFDILDRMAGSYLIYLYARFTPYIEKIRRDATRQKSYTEFEQLVQRIKRKRNLVNDAGKIR